MTSCVEAGPAWRLLLRGFNPRQSTESSYSLEDSLLALMQSHGSSCVGAGLNFSYFAEMRSGFEEGSYFRFIDSVSLDSRPRVMKKKKLRRGKTCMAPAFARRYRRSVTTCRLRLLLRDLLLLLYSSRASSMIHKSMSLKDEPSWESLHIFAKPLFLN